MADVDVLEEAAPSRRVDIPIRRSHQRFLLRDIAFSQQYSHMYYARLCALKSTAEERLLALGASPGQRVTAEQYRRVLQLEPLAASSEAVDLPASSMVYCVGTTFKVMPKSLRFLQEYTKELVRLDAGDEEEADADDAINDTDAIARDPSSVPSSGGSMVSATDALILEDESGRVELCGPSAPPPATIVTGVVIAVAGWLRTKGRFEVARYSTAAASPPVPRLMSARSTPRYIAIISGLDMAAGGSIPIGLDTMMDYLAGNIDAALGAQIGRLIVGGCTASWTEELKMKQKIRLEPSDHAKLKLADASKDPNSAAKAMRQIDSVLEQLGATIEVDVMPGESDSTNCFLPQQPVHPILLRRSTKLASVRLDTNPFEFEVEAEHTQFLLTSGQNVDDVCRQSTLTPTQALEAFLDWGCLCPTAPNTLQCYPFSREDPFIIARRPHCVVACNQPAFSTSLHEGVRCVCVPSFAATGLMVLVDVNSPALAATTVCFNPAAAKNRR